MYFIKKALVVGGGYRKNNNRHIAVKNKEGQA